MVILIRLRMAFIASSIIWGYSLNSKYGAFLHESCLPPFIEEKRESYLPLFPRNLVVYQIKVCVVLEMILSQPVGLCTKQKFKNQRCSQKELSGPATLEL